MGQGNGRRCAAAVAAPAFIISLSETHALSSPACTRHALTLAPLPPARPRAGEWERAWSIFETAYPVDTGEFPRLEELLSWDPDDEERAVRRQREADLQAQAAARHVRKVDALGRARSKP